MRNALLLIALPLLVVACNATQEEADITPTNNTNSGQDPARPVALSLINSADQVLTATTSGAVVAAPDGQRLFGVTTDGILVLDQAGTVLDRFPLPAQAWGPAATGLATRSGGEGPDLFYLANGEGGSGGTLGAIDTESGTLYPAAATFTSDYPSAIATVTPGEDADALFVADPGIDQAAVRVFPFDTFDANAGTWQDDPERRYTVPPVDLDGDGSADTVYIDNLTIFEAHAAALTFSPADAAGIAGGLFLFDPQTGDHRATVVVPTAAAGSGYVNGAALAGGRLFVSAAEGDWGDDFSFTHVQGTISVYTVASVDPFAIVDADPATATIQEPARTLTTSAPNACTLLPVQGSVLALTFPIGEEATLDNIDAAEPAIIDSLGLGGVLNTGYDMPPEQMALAGDRLYIGTGQGIVVVEVEQ